MPRGRQALVSLSVSAQRVWDAIGVDGEATEEELFVRCRPMSREGLHRALAELERGGLIAKDEVSR